MKYYKDIDYFLFFEDFPHMGVPGVAALNTDGTVNIFINTLYNNAVQAHTLRHELRHLAYGHFSADWKTITEKELEADNDKAADCVFSDDFAWVEYTGPERRPPVASVSFDELLDAVQREADRFGAVHIGLDIPPKLRFTRKEAEKYLQDARAALAAIAKDRQHSPIQMRDLA